MSKTKLSKPGVLLAILVAASSIAGYQTLRVTFLQALQNDQYTHILLILPLSVALIFVEWPSVREMMAPSLGAGCVLITISVLSAGATIWCPYELEISIPRWNAPHNSAQFSSQIWVGSPIFFSTGS